MMNLAMTGLNYEVCLIYLDDIIVLAPDLETHLHRLGLVLQRIQEMGLKLKPSKCQLLRQKVLFLGHIVSKDEVATDPAKVKAVQEWPTPKTCKEVRAILGLFSYYHRFIEQFAQVAQPLHRLLIRGVESNGRPTVRN